jgi:hypothetical protein
MAKKSKRLKDDRPLFSFFYYERDANGRDITDSPQEIMAADITHALQKLASQLTNNCAGIDVWKKRSV